MDVLAVRVHRPDGWVVDAVRLLVNGRDLVELAHDAEHASAQADGQPAIAGAYEGLAAQEVLAPSRHLLGEPLAHLEVIDDGRVALLGCECGEAGCWPLLARVEATGEYVTWSEFAQPHRAQWRHDSLGPFTFDRAQYESALGFRSGSSAAGDV